MWTKILSLHKIWLIIIGLTIFLIILGVLSVPSTPQDSVPLLFDQSPQSPSPFSSSSNELLFEVHLRLGELVASGQLTETEKAEISSLELTIQDSWNAELGYYAHIAPPSAQPISDTAVISVLSAIRDFRKTKQDKWFNIIIFDDPATARSARKNFISNSDLPDDVWCAQIFSHYRGSYSWNPTNQYEQVSLRVGCEWKSLPKR